MSKTFSSFFNELYYTKDHAYRRLRLFSEMAKPFHIYKKPITFDSTDIKFLYQFPRKFWLQAMVMRYRTDLFKALKTRHASRQELSDKKFKEILPEIQKKWEKKKNGDKLARREATLAAEEYAARHENGQLDFPKEKTYTFKPAGKAKAVSINAKTYMDQLVHKLEGEYGDPNGFDLEHPRRGSDGRHMSTRGFNFPTVDTIREMMSEWLNYIGHHMLGELPGQGDGINWRADQTGGSGKSRFDDTFTVNRIKEERYKYWYDRIPTEENVLKLWQEVLPDKKQGANSAEIRKNNSKREQLARALADRDIKKMAEDGKIRTPPTPQHPNGRAVGLGEDGDVKHPPLHIPHKKTKVKYVNSEGEEEVAEEEVPYLLPGGFLRKLSPAESDSMPDEIKSGKHWNPDSKRFEAQYVSVTDHPGAGMQGTDHIRAGALNPNNNTTGRKFLDPSDPNYNERLERLNEEIGLRKDGQSAEIYDAIEGALKTGGVGGMGNHERQVLMMMKRDLHNLAYMVLIENLDESDSNIFSIEWRKKKIRDMVAKYGQQNWGRGSRRLRDSQETHSLDSEVEEDGETMTLGEKLGQQLIKAKQQAAALKGSGKCKVGSGEKHLNTGECQFEYDLRQLHTMLDAADTEAEEADAEIKRGEDAIDGDTMGAGIKTKLDATFRAFTVLKAQFTNMGQQEKESENAAMAALQEILHDDPPAKTIISRVRYRINKLSASAGAEVEKAKLAPVNHGAEAVADEGEIRDAATKLGIVEKTLTKFLDDGKIEQYLARVETPHFDDTIKQLMVKYPTLKTRYEMLLKQISDVKKQREMKIGAAPNVPQRQESNRLNLISLLQDNRLDLIPFNDQFRRMVGEGKILLKKVNDMLEELKWRKGTLLAHPDDQDAIEAFEEIIGSKR